MEIGYNTDRADIIIEWHAHVIPSVHTVHHIIPVRFFIDFVKMGYIVSCQSSLILMLSSFLDLCE